MAKKPRVEHCHVCMQHDKRLTPAILCMRNPAYQETIPYGYCEECYTKRCQMLLDMLHDIITDYKTLIDTRIEMYEKYGVKNDRP